MSKITFPSNFIIDFYYYYSTFLLVICWCIAPLLFYVILTQSKKLNSIKWLILNHTFWCLALETLLGLVKPLFMSPCAGGIQLGYFKDFGTFQNTAYSAMICFCLVYNCMYGLVATISSRYMFVFPSKLMALQNVKANFIYTIVLLSASYLLVFIAFSPVLNVESKQLFDWVLEYDPNLISLLNDKTFFMIPYENIRYIVLASIAFLCFTIFGSTLFSFFFIGLIFKNKTKTTTKFQKSLILSCVMQIHFTNIFLLLPFLMFFIFMAFNIPNSASAMCIFMSIFMTHCLVEFLATLYFISPYRNFILAFFKNVNALKIGNRNISSNNQISVLI